MLSGLVRMSANEICVLCSWAVSVRLMFATAQMGLFERMRCRYRHWSLKLLRPHSCVSG